MPKISPVAQFFIGNPIVEPLLEPKARVILKSRRAFGKRVLNVMRGHVFIIYTLWQAVCLDSLGYPNKNI